MVKLAKVVVVLLELVVKLIKVVALVEEVVVITQVEKV
jgi:hypothetical protein